MPARRPRLRATSATAWVHDNHKADRADHSDERHRFLETGAGHDVPGLLPPNARSASGDDATTSETKRPQGDERAWGLVARQLDQWRWAPGTKLMAPMEGTCA
jgi:hypothetical protein